MAAGTPRAEDRALVLALQGRWEEALRLQLDWDVLVGATLWQRVAPLLYSRIRRDGSDGKVPRQVLAQIAMQYRYTRWRNQVQGGVLRDVLDRFDAAGIPSLALKGAALAGTVYGDIGLRPMCDQDLLIHSEDIDRALDALHRAGYRRANPPELRPGFNREFGVHVGVSSPGPQPCSVELHWHLTPPLFVNRHVDYRGVWQRAQPTMLAERPTHVLGPEDWVLHQAAHAVYAHRLVRLLDLCDMDRLVRYLGNRLDWEATLSIGAEYRWLPALATVLSQTVALFGTPVPGRVIERAAAALLPGLDRWQMRWWLAPGGSELRARLLEPATLPGLAPRLRFVWANLIPSRAYVLSLYGGQPARPLPHLYVHRLWRKLVRSGDPGTRLHPVYAPQAGGRGRFFCANESSQETELANLTDTARYMRNPAVVLSEEDENAGLLFNPDTDQVRVLNSTGLLIWKLCDGCHDLPALVGVLRQDFEEAPVDQVSGEVQTFMKAMVASGFVGIVEE